MKQKYKTIVKRVDGQELMGSQKQIVPLIIDFVDEMYKEHRMAQWNYQNVEQEFVLPLCPGKDTHLLPSCQHARAVGSRLDSEK